MTRLVDKWWDKIETSKKFAQNKKEILEYHKILNSGDVTLIGLIAEGGQGMRTGNNGRFLGFLKDTEQAKEICYRQKELIEIWNSHSQIKLVFTKVMRENDNDFESVVETLKSQFNPARELALKRGEVYRVVDPREITNPYSWDEPMRQNVCLMQGPQDLLRFLNEFQPHVF